MSARAEKSKAARIAKCLKDADQLCFALARFDRLDLALLRTLIGMARLRVSNTTGVPHSSNQVPTTVRDMKRALTALEDTAGGWWTFVPDEADPRLPTRASLKAIRREVRRVRGLRVEEEPSPASNVVDFAEARRLALTRRALDSSSQP